MVPGVGGGSPERSPGLGKRSTDKAREQPGRQGIWGINAPAFLFSALCCPASATHWLKVRSAESDFLILWTVAHQVPLHGISQARILEWVAIPLSRGSSRPGIEPHLPHCRQILYCLSHQGSPLAEPNKKPETRESVDPAH